MAKSKETFGKKEIEKKKQKKRQDKAERKEMRKADKEPGKSLEDQIMYVDENGNLTSEKPDPNKRAKINAEDIELGVPNRPAHDPVRKGRVTYFDDAKGYGFITDRDNDERIFVHASELEELVQVNDKVTFEKGRGPKGPIAINVRKIKLGQ
ncbi:MAG: cold shock domain-containing protein [Saprospiraceae bacterium]|jgi:cold shock CspA family protein|nr:cold shock domain-containing protein [Saprospiraceae bacterium]